jgi:hypothetical protein
MRYDDFFEDDVNPCDDEAFRGSLYHVGTSQIDALFTFRAARCPDLADSTFFALIAALLDPFEQFLAPEQFEELWEMVYMTQYEVCKERDPGVDYDACKDQVKQHLSPPRKSSPKPSRPVRSKKKRK